VRLEDGRELSALMSAKIRTTKLIAFDIGQEVMVEMSPFQDDLCRIDLNESRFRKVDPKDVGR
jgi:translation initiation factor IF-1